MKLIPNHEHPHEGTQRELQTYDRNMWLVWIPSRSRWAVVWKAPTLGMTPNHLRESGLVTDRLSRWQLAKMCWDKNGHYVCPTMYRALIIQAVRGNDAAVHGLVEERADEMDRRMDEERDRARDRQREGNRDLARDSWNRIGVNKTMSLIGSGESIDYAKNRGM